MLTYCILCTHLIPEKRQAKKACTCSPECQKQLYKERRQERVGKRCRTCGRTPPKKALEMAALTEPQGVGVEVQQ